MANKLGPLDASSWRSELQERVLAAPKTRRRTLLSDHFADYLLKLLADLTSNPSTCASALDWGPIQISIADLVFVEGYKFRLSFVHNNTTLECQFTVSRVDLVTADYRRVVDLISRLVVDFLDEVAYFAFLTFIRFNFIGDASVAADKMEELLLREVFPTVPPRPVPQKSEGESLVDKAIGEVTLDSLIKETESGNASNSSPSQ